MIPSDKRQTLNTQTKQRHSNKRGEVYRTLETVVEETEEETKTASEAD